MGFFNKRIETLSRDELELLQKEKLCSMLVKIFGYNRFYTKKFRDYGVNPNELKSLSDFQEFPLTNKSELLEAQEGGASFGTNVTFEEGAYTRFHQTSGTTGKPLNVFDTPESWEWWGNCWGHVFAGAGITEKDRLSVLFAFGPFIGFWAAVEGARKINALMIPGGGKDSLQRLQLMKELGATAICCTPTYALRLAEVASDSNFDLGGISIRKIINAGEPGANVPSTKNRIESIWEAKCYDHAGASEIGAHSFECEIQPKGMHVIESEFIVEVLNPDTLLPVNSGELGEMIITNLGRVGYPVIRYRSGDLVRLNKFTCECGRTFSRLEGGILGRVDDMIVVRGINIFPSAIENIIHQCNSVKEYRVIVSTERKMRKLTIELELNEHKRYEKVLETVDKALRDNLGLRSEIKVVPQGSLPRYDMKSKRFHVNDN